MAGDTGVYGGRLALVLAVFVVTKKWENETGLLDLIMSLLPW